MMKNKVVTILLLFLLVLTGCAADEEELTDAIIDTAIKVEKVKNTVENVVDAVDNVKDTVVEKIEPEKTFSNDCGVALVAPGTWINVNDTNSELFIKNDEDVTKCIQVTCLDDVPDMFDEMVEFISQAHALYIDARYTSEEIIHYYYPQYTYEQQYVQEIIKLMSPFWERGYATKAELEDVFCEVQAMSFPLMSNIPISEYKIIKINIMGEQEYCLIGTYYDDSASANITMFRTFILSDTVNYCILAESFSDVVNEAEMVSIIESFTSADLEKMETSQELIYFDKYLMTEADYIKMYTNILATEGFLWSVYDENGYPDLWHFEIDASTVGKGYLVINDEYIGEFQFKTADAEMAKGFFFDTRDNQEHTLTVHIDNKMPIVKIDAKTFNLE